MLLPHPTAGWQHAATIYSTHTPCVHPICSQNAAWCDAVAEGVSQDVNMITSLLLMSFSCPLGRSRRRGREAIARVGCGASSSAPEGQHPRVVLGHARSPACTCVHQRRIRLWAMQCNPC